MQIDHFNIQIRSGDAGRLWENSTCFTNADDTVCYLDAMEVFQTHSLSYPQLIEARVRANNAWGEGDWSSLGSFVQVWDVPDAPYIVDTCTEVTDTTATIYW